MMTDSELRALAERTLASRNKAEELAESHCPYSVYADAKDQYESDRDLLGRHSSEVISLLDRLAAAEKVVEAARQLQYGRGRPDFSGDTPVGRIALMSLDTALAALDGELGR